MPQIYGWVSENAKQGKSRTRAMPSYQSALVKLGDRIITRPNLTETKGPIWDGVPPNQ